LPRDGLGKANTWISGVFLRGFTDKQLDEFVRIVRELEEDFGNPQPIATERNIKDGTLILDDVHISAGDRRQRREGRGGYGERTKFDSMSFFTSWRRRRREPRRGRGSRTLNLNGNSLAMPVSTRKSHAVWTLTVVLLLTLGSVQAENMRHGRLVALLSDPGSDLSGLKGDYNLQAAAALDARLYFKKHNNREYEKDCLEIGLEHAVKHHLKGRAVDVYAFAFDEACSVFFER
jgi:hypothetical protein